MREGRERVRTAIRNADFAFPPDRITANRAADLRKEGSSFDPPIALGILSATGSVRPERAGPSALVGELSLDGQIHAVRGALAVGLACWRKGIAMILVPRENRVEAAAVGGLRVLAASTLHDAVSLLNGETTPYDRDDPAIAVSGAAEDLKISTSPTCAARRTPSARWRSRQKGTTNYNNVLLVGSPGTGKTMPACRLTLILAVARKLLGDRDRVFRRAGLPLKVELTHDATGQGITR